MKLFRLMRIACLFFLLAGIANLPVIAQTTGSISAWDNHSAGFTVPGTNDNWGAYDSHVGYRCWMIWMFNQSNTTYTNATMWVPNSTFNISQTYLYPGDVFRRDFYIYEPLTLGFDSSRQVEPLIIPASGTRLQKVTVKITPMDAIYDPNAPGIGQTDLEVRIWGMCVSSSSSDAGAGQFDPSEQKTEWQIKNPIMGKEYSFIANINVFNQGNLPINSKPQVNLSMSVWYSPILITGSQSVSIHDNSLAKVPDFGPSANEVFYSIGEVADWHPRPPEEHNGITYEAFNQTVPVAVDKGILWPPNHKMIPVTVIVNPFDFESGFITSVTSNEPEDGLGDGDMSPDWVITGDLTVDLRAERSGTGSGRVYTITVKCKNYAGNSSFENVEVIVPHDQKK